MNYKLSIITICYNDLDGLKKTTTSVISQTNKQFEWVIVDGASSDGSKEYIEQIAKTNSGINIIWGSEPDTGIYNAMNKGVTKASGEYVLFMNGGDIFCSNKSIERALRKEWNADVISCDEFVINNKKYWDYIQSPRKVTFHRILTGYLPHQTTFIKRSLLQEYPYKEDYKIVADWAFWWETLVASDHTYQHFDFPLAAFDLLGISSTNHDNNYAERAKFLSQYISNPYLLNKIANECGMNCTIEGEYLFNSERSLLHTIFLLIRRIYVHIHQPLHRIYANVRWR